MTQAHLHNVMNIDGTKCKYTFCDSELHMWNNGTTSILLESPWTYENLKGHSLLKILPTCIVGNNYNYETMLTNSCSKIICTSQRDGFTEWTSSIDIDCCHLENILSVWSKTINDVTCGHYQLVLLYIPASTTGCMVPYNVASNWPILLDTRQLSPHEGYFSGLYKHALQ